ncbi:MAG: sulfatase-like hydrolase/transferase [Verrucomicrobiales bacterium]|nr:sulfatase-like hydrolase/transferase [Verrucomicrobiales bacterium]
MKLHAIFSLFAALLLTTAVADAAPRQNVLFIAIDDLNDYISPLGGNPAVKTPNFERLAEMSMTFTNAHCSSPVCTSSRTAVMTGVEPFQSGVYTNKVEFLPTVKRLGSLNREFLEDGYFTAGAGKIYHAFKFIDDDWSETFRPGKWPSVPKKRQRSYAGGFTQVGSYLDKVEPKTGDYRATEWAIERLQHQRDEPFFIACGIYRPHVPWNVPQKYYDLYPLDQIKVPEALLENTDLDDVPEFGRMLAWTGLGEKVHESYEESPHAAILRDGDFEELLQAYYAGISYADAMLGRLLDSYEAHPERDNTALVVWSDHGWHLGEKAHWRKSTLWDQATRVPFFVRVPGITTGGSRCDRPVSLIDIYPTLREVCELGGDRELAGDSLVPLLRDPEGGRWRDYALTSYLDQSIAVRTPDYRLIRYPDGTAEFYDHRVDPEELENRYGEPDYSEALTELEGLLPSQMVDPLPRIDGEAKKSPHSAGSSSPAETGSTRPDILWIVADDMGYGDTGFNGLEDFQTPSLDALAAAGAVCTDGYATHPFCGPSRAALMAGRYQQRFQFYGNPMPKGSKNYDPAFGLPPTEMTAAKHLSTLGYRTGMIGKWHLGSEEIHHPLNHGFTDFLGFLEGHRNYYRTDIDWMVRESAGKEITTVPVHESYRDDYLTDFLTDGAVDLIQSTEREQPLFLYLAYNAPHTPMQATQPWLDKVPGIEDPLRRIYAAMVTSMDDGIGKVIEALKETGRYENTLIFFFSDNGGIPVVNGADNGGLNGMKGNLLEGGIRVPFSVSWPNRIEGGARFEKPIVTIDAYATSLAAAGIENPSPDSVNLLPYLTGRREGDPHKALFWRTGGKAQFAVRAGDHKILGVRTLETRHFNLESDSGEKRPLDLSDQTADRLQDYYRDWESGLPATNKVSSPDSKWPEQEKALGLPVSRAARENVKRRIQLQSNLLKKALPPAGN